MRSLEKKEREKEQNKDAGESEKENKEDRKEVPTRRISPSFVLFPLLHSALSPGSLEMRRQAASDPASG